MPSHSWNWPLLTVFFRNKTKAWKVLLLRRGSRLFNKETLLNQNPSLTRKPFATPLHLLCCNFKMNLVTHHKYAQGFTLPDALSEVVPEHMQNAGRILPKTADLLHCQQKYFSMPDKKSTCFVLGVHLATKQARFGQQNRSQN